MRIRVLLALLVTTLLIPVAESAGQAPAEQPPTGRAKETSDTIVYTNAQYGFRVTLPASWKGFTVVRGEWGGGEGAAAIRGLKISLRHPKWTEDQPRQDIPIMIFTLAQWKAVDDGDVAVSAAPMPPGELGRNRKYVFALPPRYNYAFPDGWEEVQKILDSEPLHAY